MKMILAMMPTIVLVVYGQLIVKWRIGKMFHLSGSSGPLGRLLIYVIDPYVLSSYAAALAGSIAWVFVVERYPISIAFPMYVGLTVAAVALGGTVLFGEVFSISKIIAISFILIGVVIGSQS